ncbi:PLC-like phosphodiesterase [Jaminaea rosea]|uniref:PLC-like phosphodiesterase n=1 Tax=Jaminaea rosea TaxID=1569628 RepID=A0A316UZS1_9BASI|nr:PLC-like phosphodiesterase [Jaminaea rosea]PWN30799.1 PLC-like phosphodiesterase [Jaminaea rosea]
MACPSSATLVSSAFTPSSERRRLIEQSNCAASSKPDTMPPPQKNGMEAQSARSPHISMKVIIINRLPKAIAPIPVQPRSVESQQGEEATSLPELGEKASVCPAATSDSPTVTLNLGKEYLRRRKLTLDLCMVDAGTANLSSSSDNTRCRVTLRCLGSNGSSHRCSSRHWRLAAVSLPSAAAGSASTLASPPFYALQTIAGPHLHVLLLPSRATASWQSNLPSSWPISSLCLPGTHETLARYGWPITKCQSLAAVTGAQVKAGIRWMDFRVTPKGEKGKERLLAYHGSTSQRIELGAALQPIYDWLSSDGKKETLILSLKPEGGASSADVERLLYSLYITGEIRVKFWWLDNRIPTLGEARGKLVLFSRFGGGNDQPGGIHPPIWPDNFKGHFAYSLPTAGQGVVTQDWYKIGGSYKEIPTKFGLATELLTLDHPAPLSNPDGTPRDPSEKPASGPGPASDPTKLVINFLSASSVPLALPPLIAKGFGWTSKAVPPCLRVQGMNSKMAGWVADRLVAEATAPGKAEGKEEHVGALDNLQCTFPTDFYDDDTLPDGVGGGNDGKTGLLVSLLIEANFTRAANTKLADDQKTAGAKAGWLPSLGLPWTGAGAAAKHEAMTKDGAGL